MQVRSALAFKLWGSVGSTFADMTTIVSGIYMPGLALTSFVCIDVDGSEELANIVEWLELLNSHISRIAPTAMGSSFTGLGFDSSPGECMVKDR